jgi:UrcA family protein
MGNMSRLGAASAALAMSLCATAAVAADRVTVTAKPTDFLEERVSYADLNLAVAPGQRVLQQRVRKAAHTVCQPHQLGDLFGFDYRHCRNQALEKVKPQMDLAFRRAMEIATRGSSSIPPVAIAVVAGAVR